MANMASSAEEGGVSYDANNAPAKRQLERALTLLGYDLAYRDEHAHAMDYLAGFAQRHGSLSANTIAAVAHRFEPPLRTSGGNLVGSDHAEARESQMLEEKDILFALVALGVLHLSEALPLLLPYLESSHAQERWLAALSLVSLHNEQALPAIERMLVEFVGPHQPEGIYTFQLWRHWLLRLLADWGDLRVVPFIRAGLIATVRAVELKVPAPQDTDQEFVDSGSGIRYTGHEAWQQFHQELGEWIKVEHQLVYTLGRMGAFASLMGIPTHPNIYYRVTTWKQSDDGKFQPVAEVPESHADADVFCSNIWRVHACFGALEPQFSGHLEWTYTFASVPALAKAIERLLEEQFGLDEAARHQAMEDYERADYVNSTMAYYQWVAEQA